MNLNTIIEEEKKHARDWFTSEYCVKRPAQGIRWIRSIFFDDCDQITKILESHDRAITTAMQRAYEAGKADSAQENTPDTEWGVKNFREGLEKVCKYADTNYCPGCGLTPEGFDHLLTSRDTYWKERVRKWANENSKELSDPYPFDSKYTYSDFVSVSDLEAFLTNEDNLK